MRRKGQVSGGGAEEGTYADELSLCLTGCLIDLLLVHFVDLWNGENDQKDCIEEDEVRHNFPNQVQNVQYSDRLERCYVVLAEDDIETSLYHAVQRVHSWIHLGMNGLCIELLETKRWFGKSILSQVSHEEF